MSTFENMAKGYHQSIKRMHEHTQEVASVRSKAVAKGMTFGFKARHESSPKAGERQEWTEYQFKVGRKIVHRCETLSQAMKYIEQN